MSTLSQQLGIRRRIDRTVSPLQHRQTVRLGEGRNGMTPNNIVEIAARVADKHKESVRMQRINVAVWIAVWSYVAFAAVAIAWMVTR